MIDFQALNRRLLADVRAAVPGWLPGGAIRGHEYKCGSIKGGKGESFSVNLITGAWKEFAGDAPGGSDLISLYSAVYGMSQAEAARALGWTNGQSYTPVDARPEPEHVQAPPNSELAPSIFVHHKLGMPSHFWVYRDADGQPIYATARYDTPDGKQVLPWAFNGLKWKSKGYPAPRPLYGLDRLAGMPAQPVLLCEGEKATDAAQRYFPTRPCLTWCGGVGQWKQAQWSALEGKTVTLWPDADEPGWTCMAGIAGKLLGLGCTVRLVDTHGKPEGWDLADAETAGTPKGDVVAFAKAHTTPVALSEEPPVIPALPRVQSLPPAGSQTFEMAPIAGSKTEVWQRWGFLTKSNGRPHPNIHNVGCSINARGEMDVWYDEFSQRVMSGVKEWDESLNMRFTVWVQRVIGMPEVSPKTVSDGMAAYAFHRPRNPVADWLNGLTHDGTSRLKDLMPLGMGAERSEYTEQVGRCFLIGMVARILQPGCKVDCMPIFEGPQGALKSTALKIIGGDYFAEIHESIDSKDFYLAITGKMLCEISELHAFKRAEVERIKGIISTATDRYRAPYDRTAADHPRSCVFAGTTNLDDWNTDETGARRFWPIKCGAIDTNWLAEHRTQLFAEAVERFKDGENWWQIPEDVADVEREHRRALDPWEDALRGYLASHDTVYIGPILSDVLGVKTQDVNKSHYNRVGAILRANHYHSTVAQGVRCFRKKW